MAEVLPVTGSVAAAEGVPCALPLPEAVADCGAVAEAVGVAVAAPEGVALPV